MKRRIAILFDNFGPYHLARLKAAAEVFDLLAVEFGVSSSEYAWDQQNSEGFQRVAINESGSSGEMRAAVFAKRLDSLLSDFKPEVVFIPGWGSREALLVLQWCRKKQVPSVVMSDSTAWDEKRIPLKEWIKKQILKSYSSALVAGSPHCDYLVQLGFQRDRISLGYDVVDNDFFAKRVKEIKKSEVMFQGGAEKPYFLASARFIEKKNLSFLLRAYAIYRESSKTSTEESRLSAAHVPWDLVLIGDGPLRPDLSSVISEFQFEGCVQMPGFKQYAELPAYYASAGAFIHPSTTEQWGLVVNEAMAAGLPVLVSNRCGCASDLVKEGGNGWTFDPTDLAQLALLMGKMATDSSSRIMMGHRSREIIAEWSLSRFANGASEATEIALKNLKDQKSLLLKILLTVLAKR